MITQPDKPKRWRPRFSVRTLVILVTLLCCYAACWGPTKRDGVTDVLDQSHIWTYDESGAVVAPLIVRQRELNPDVNDLGISDAWCYYFWFFGYVAKLPWEREIPLPSAAQLPVPSTRKPTTPFPTE